MTTRKSGEGKPANRPGLRVVRGERDAAASSANPAQTIFDDVRSGRDRRDVEAAAAGRTVDESKRAASERRRGQVKQDAWWLDRDYVESHHFVQKAAGGRGRKSDDEPNSEE